MTKKSGGGSKEGAPYLKNYLNTRADDAKDASHPAMLFIIDQTNMLTYQTLLRISTYTGLHLEPL